MSITCLVCNGKHFRKGYYEVDTDVDIYSTAYNSTTAHNIASPFTIPEPIEVETTIHNETAASSKMELRIITDEKSDNYFVNVYQYICEDCGYIMSFTKEFDALSKKEQHKQRQKENAYDWTRFGKEIE
ncbi:hypothetical protein ACFQ3N_03125 [Virgibacillus byunsanensis]|uniref:Uncharacterized protein n=1 Tax=Virgibacillus byunsanensis TaxID=570945 RepID=A0ABW3LGA0_9BACI